MAERSGIVRYRRSATSGSARGRLRQPGRVLEAVVAERHGLARGQAPGLSRHADPEPVRLVDGGAGHLERRLLRQDDPVDPVVRLEALDGQARLHRGVEGPGHRGIVRGDPVEQRPQREDPRARERARSRSRPEARGRRRGRSRRSGRSSRRSRGRGALPAPRRGGSACPRSPGEGCPRGRRAPGRREAAAAAPTTTSRIRVPSTTTDARSIGALRHPVEDAHVPDDERDSVGLARPARGAGPAARGSHAESVRLTSAGARARSATLTRGTSSPRR